MKVWRMLRAFSPRPTELHNQHAASDVRFAISPVTSEGMDCPCSRQNLATVRHTARNQILLASFDRNAPAVNQQCVAALHNQHVLIEIMDMLGGSCGLSACPERHLALIRSVEHISFNAGSRPILPGDPVRGVPHELWEGIHAGACYRNQRVPDRTLNSGERVLLGLL